MAKQIEAESPQEQYELNPKSTYHGYRFSRKISLCLVPGLKESKLAYSLPCNFSSLTPLQGSWIWVELQSLSPLCNNPVFISCLQNTASTFKTVGHENSATTPREASSFHTGFPLQMLAFSPFQATYFLDSSVI